MSAPATMPWNQHAEEALLCAAMIDTDVVGSLAATLKPEHFYAERHRLIWDAMLSMRAEGEAVDPVTVEDALKRRGELAAAGGSEHLGYLLDVAPHALSAKTHAGIIREHAERRAIIRAAETAIAEARTGALKAKEVAAALATELVPVAAASATGGFRQLKEYLFPAMQSIEDRAAGREAPGIPTGYKAIDSHIAGLRGGDLMIAASVPGGGKTALGLNILLNAARAGYEGAMVSAEMSARALTERLLGNLAQVDSVRLRAGRLVDDEWPRLARAGGELSYLPLHIDDSPRPDIREVAARVRALKTKHPGLKLVVVDFIQLIRSGDDEMMALALTNITYDLKGLAKELDVAIIATCQVDAAAVEKAESPRPKIHHLRWSQGIREGADLVAMLYRPKMYDPMAEDVMEVAFEKARDLPTFVATLRWIGKYMKVEDHASYLTPRVAA